MKSKLSVLGGSQAWIIWVIANLIVILGFNLQTGYAILNENIAKEIGMNLWQVGLIGSVYAGVFSIMQLFSGSILDNLGLRKVFPVGVSFITVGAVMLATATSFEVALISQIFLAIGGSFGFVGAGFTGGLWFGFAKFGVMFGLTQTVASLGSFAGQYIYAELLSYGILWRDIIWGMSSFGIVVFVLTITLIKDPVLSTDGKSAFSENKFEFALFKKVILNIADVLKIRDMWLVSINGMITFGVYLAIAVLWGPKIINAHGYSPYLSGVLSSLLWIGLAIFSPICDMISMKLKNRRIVNLIFLLIETIALAILIYVPNLGIFSIGIIMLFFGIGASGHMQVFSAGADMVKPELVGTSAAIVNGMMFIGTGILISLPNNFLPNLAETTLTLNDFQDCFWIYFILLFIACLSVIMMKESFKK